MAKKSKTQKAKASAARQARKAERKLEEAAAVETGEKLAEGSADGDKAVDAAASSNAKVASAKKDASKGDKGSKKAETESKGIKKSEEKKPKKQHFKFLREVRAELKRVTWPTKIDVMRWSGVVVAALLFFGIFVAILDNFIVTPLLVLISGADPSSIDWLNVFTGSADIDASSADVSGGDASSSADSSASDAGVSPDSAEAEVAEDAAAAEDAAPEE